MKRLTAIAMLLVCPFAQAVDRCSDLQGWYNGYNEQYFQNRLPHNTIVKREPWDKSVEYVAKTEHVGDHFVITFNNSYKLGAIMEHQVLKHEMCHVATWTEDDGHGKAWVACMVDLERQGSFHDDQINVYRKK